MSADKALQEAAARGNELTGLDVFQKIDEDVSVDRVQELLSQMNKDVPSGGIDIGYGDLPAQRLRFWKAGHDNAPLVVYIHGGSWSSGTYLDSIGSAKVAHLNRTGYAVASVDYRPVPTITVEEQAQEVAHSIRSLVDSDAARFDRERIVLMGHSSGAHVAALLGTDLRYLEKAQVDVNNVRGVICLDGSEYNAPAEFIDSPGPVADNMVKFLGKDIARLQSVSPVHNAKAPNVAAFLLLHVQRQGGIRQAMEFAAVLEAAGTDANLHVFEGVFFEGHMQLLLRLGDEDYPATSIMDEWLRTRCSCE